MKKILFLLACLLISCADNTLFSEYVSIPKYWQRDNPILFSFHTEDTLSTNDIFINIRNNQSYPFRNIFLITKIQFPNNDVVIDTIEYEMATVQGEWLGKGFSVKDSKLWFKENWIFPLKGVYHFSIEQADRKLGENKGVEKLEGITDVGLQIDKKKSL